MRNEKNEIDLQTFGECQLASARFSSAVLSSVVAVRSLVRTGVNWIARGNVRDGRKSKTAQVEVIQRRAQYLPRRRSLVRSGLVWRRRTRLGLRRRRRSRARQICVGVERDEVSQSVSGIHLSVGAGELLRAPAPSGLDCSRPKAKSVKASRAIDLLARTIGCDRRDDNGRG